MAVRLVPQLPVRVLSPTEFATRLRRIRGGQSTSWVADSHAVVSRVLGSSNDPQFDAPESTTAASPSPLRQNVEVVIGDSPARDTSGIPWSLPDSDVQLLSPWSGNPCPSSTGGDKKKVGIAASLARGEYGDAQGEEGEEANDSRQQTETHHRRISLASEMTSPFFLFYFLITFLECWGSVCMMWRCVRVKACSLYSTVSEARCCIHMEASKKEQNHM
ncbi:hypothetical protein TcCL_ESM02708 [Trypanosoma cruzi]|nr:hypothetical protein TcCL_ESM02708 [Trypanosoma cruzi]